jgi:hypothetical protein
VTQVRDMLSDMLRTYRNDAFNRVAEEVKARRDYVINWVDGVDPQSDSAAKIIAAYRLRFGDKEPNRANQPISNLVPEDQNGNNPVEMLPSAITGPEAEKYTVIELVEILEGREKENNHRNYGGVKGPKRTYGVGMAPRALNVFISGRHLKLILEKGGGVGTKFKAELVDAKMSSSYHYETLRLDIA